MKTSALYKLDPVSEEKELIVILGENTFIGKSTQADVKLRDMRCSGIHALLTQNTDRNFTLIDLNSHFGTYVEGEKISEISLSVGDSFNIGSSFFKIEQGRGFEKLKKVSRLRSYKERESRKQKNKKRFFDLFPRRKLLEVSLFWGDELLDIKTFSKRTKITLGSKQDDTFSASFSGPRFKNKSLKIAKYGLLGLKLFVPIEATGIVWRGNNTHSLDSMRLADPKTNYLKDLKLLLKKEDRADIQFKELSLSFRFVKPPMRLGRSLVPRFSIRSVQVLGIFLFVYAIMFVLLSLTKVNDENKKIKIPKKIQKVLFNAGIEEAQKRRIAAIGQILQNLQKGRARAEEGKATPKRTLPKAKKQIVKKIAKPKIRVKKKVVRKIAKVDKKVALNKVKKSVAPTEVVPKIDFEQTEVASIANEFSKLDTLMKEKNPGNTSMALVGGHYARGKEGLGAGGGGKSVGIGQLKGVDAGGALGSKDYGLDASFGRELKVEQEKEIIILGGLDPDIIAAVIKRYLPQIRNCYEQQLVLNPRLRGKVTVSFLIGGKGSVDTSKVFNTTLKSVEAENCMIQKILTWKFPKPRGGGKVGVKYPFLLQSTRE